MTANKDYKTLLKQTKIFKVKNVILSEITSYEEFKKKNKNKKINVQSDFNSLNKIFKKKIDYTMSSITGLDGLKPTLEIIKYSKTIAIANKESIICGWNLISAQIKKYKVNFIPVDSEHFSIWYAIKKNNIKIDNIILTASGGPFFKLPLSKFKHIKTSQALKHPNWSMGKKISIDSATMMNKVFEIIEAKKIFNLNYNKLDILVHPSSYIHAIIKFNDGMIKIIAHDTNMKIPIFNSLYYKKIKKIKTDQLNLKKLNFLNLKYADSEKFPSIKIIKILQNKSSLLDTIIVLANDELVNLFLLKKINFNDIMKILLKLINMKEFRKYNNKKPGSIKNIIYLDKYIRKKINKIIN